MADLVCLESLPCVLLVSHAEADTSQFCFLHTSGIYISSLTGGKLVVDAQEITDFPSIIMWPY